MRRKYCRKIKKISEGKENISEETFLDWYVDWLFNDEDYLDNDDSNNNDDSKEGNRKNKYNTKIETLTD